VAGSWISRLFLAGLDDESYVVRKKAFIFAWISVILIPLLIIPTVINLTTAASTHPLLISAVNILMIIGFIAALMLLRRGRFDIAVTVSIVFVSLRVAAGVLGKLDTWVATGSNNNIYFMFAALAFTAFFGTRRLQFAMAALFIALNIAVLAYAKSAGTLGFNLFLGSTINTIIAILIVMSLSWLISSITERSLYATEEELRKNIALGRALERRIQELGSMYDKQEQLNAELTASSNDLIEANKNLMIYKNFAEESGQGLGMSMIDGTVIYANRALAALLEEKESTAVLGKKFISYYPDDVRPGVAGDIVRKVVRQGQWAGELPLCTAKGRVIPTIQNIFLMRDEEGSPLYLALVVTDLTDRKQLEMKLLMAQKMEAIGRLTGGIAHDFNNILTAIMGFSELMLRDLDPGDPRRAYAVEIKKAGRLSSDIVRQLLAFSKNQIIKQTDFDLNAEIDSMHKMLRRFIREDIEIDIDLQDGPLVIFADPSQVGQVIINLVINASDAITGPGRISITTRARELGPGDAAAYPGAAPGACAVLSIKDNGAGMDEETLGRLYEPFYSTKEPDRGTGLGLSVVYGIVKRNRGWISVDSVRGSGTVFDVFLPVADADGKADIPAEGETRGARGRGERVLVVEDQEKVRSFAATILKDNNYVVFEAGSAGEALGIFEREEGDIDLLFSDVVLPGESGLHLVDELLRKKKDLAVLLTSGYTDQRGQLDIINERRYELLLKPYSLDDLLARVGGLLRPKS
jgi:PAS domain S-box-containing protein